jgi:hypothetical protein
MQSRVHCRSDIEYAQTPLSWMFDGQCFKVRKILREARTPDEKYFLVETAADGCFHLSYRSDSDTWDVIPEG